MKDHWIVRGRYIVRSPYRVRDRWAVRVRDRITGQVRQVTTHARTAAAARREVVELLEEVEREGGPDRTPRIREALEEYLGLAEARVRATTLRHYRALTERYIRPHMGTLRVSELTPERVERWVAELSRTLAPLTVREVVRYLGTVTRWCQRRGWLARVPTHGIQLPRPDQKAPLALSPEEARELVADLGRSRARRALRRAVLVALYTGLRRRTVYGLEWRHVDLARSRLQVPAHLMKSRRHHVVPLHPVLEREIRAWAGELRRLDLDGHVVGRRAGSWQAIAEAGRRIGIERLHFHALRHTVSTWLDEHASQAVVAAVLDHLPQTMTGHYTHPTEARVRAAIESLPDLLTADSQGASRQPAEGG